MGFQSEAKIFVEEEIRSVRLLPYRPNLLLSLLIGGRGANGELVNGRDTANEPCFSTNIMKLISSTD